MLDKAVPDAPEAPQDLKIASMGTALRGYLQRNCIESFTSCQELRALGENAV